ncbi:glycosyl hydrolase family 8 [Proteus myxofaciens]|uniref:Glucanase n=1 Tax=Proteus myxofaciens ATCC 19692 TaxID=1354337 RepID=A0A198FWE7_9GAMM|nr:glycosyl hydrolase family 8 [Proteus myxofaciens]OAT29367.1 endoglucanase [Proteus myxofaciens ATCC 19692]
MSFKHLSRFNYLFSVFFILGLLLIMSPSLHAANTEMGWQQFKARYVTDNGRVVDNANQNISHSEGQGYGMLMAVMSDDRETFNKLWDWTSSSLYRSDLGLFIWRYEPDNSDHTPDLNNATDGDILIAWALLKAGEKWDDESYISASEAIQRAILEHTLVKTKDYTILLPGIDGFKTPDEIIINPSYFIFPAWEDFYRVNKDPRWEILINDSQSLLKKMRFGEYQLPSDWVSLYNNGKLEPSKKWPARFSFDAIRIPLYLSWGNKESALQPFIDYFQKFDRYKTPAWISIDGKERAEYNLTPGMMAIRDLTLKTPIEDVDLSKDTDYYSSALHLLSAFAQNGQ